MQPCQKLLKGKYMQPVCILLPRDCRKVCSFHAHSPFLQAVLISQSADVSKMTFPSIATRSRQENVSGMAHRIGVPATTSHASEEEKCLTKEDGSSGEIAKAVKAGMAFRPFLCDIIP
jgi:hypothetical protein